MYPLWSNALSAKSVLGGRMALALVSIKAKETYLACTSNLLLMRLSVHTKDMISVRASVGVSIHQDLVIWILGVLPIVILQWCSDHCST